MVGLWVANRASGCSTVAARIAPTATFISIFYAAKRSLVPLVVKRAEHTATWENACERGRKLAKRCNSLEESAANRVLKLEVFPREC